MDVVPVEYGKLSQMYHLVMCFFQFISGVAYRWYVVLCWIVVLLMWIGFWSHFRPYKAPTDQVK